MRRKLMAAVAVCSLLVAGYVVVRFTTRQRAEVLAELSDVIGTHGRGPFGYEDRLLVATESKLQLIDSRLNPVATFPTSTDVTAVSASGDLSVAVVLENHRFCVIDTRTGAQKWHPLDQFSTEISLSPDGSRLWVSEYDTGFVHLYELSDVDARRVQSVNVKDQAGRVLGRPALVGPLTFAVVATANDGRTTYLFTDRYDAILIYDWGAGRTVGSVTLPSINSFPRFVQSPKGDRLAIVSNRLVFIDLNMNAVVVDRELDDLSRAGDFNAAGDRFFVAYTAPDMFALPLTHRAGQIDEFDLSGNRVQTWHTRGFWVREFGARGAVPWMFSDHGRLQTLRLP